MSRIANHTPVIKPATLDSLHGATAHGYGAPSTHLARTTDGKLPEVEVGGRAEIKLEELEAPAVPKQPNSPAQVTQTEEPLRVETTEQAIKRIVAAAPPLSLEQRERLALLLGGAS